jgi:hypothetical protein
MLRQDLDVVEIPVLGGFRFVDRCIAIASEEFEDTKEVIIIRIS